MKIALIGYGRMGTLVERVAGDRGVEVAGHFTSRRPLRADSATRKALQGIDVLIDFSVGPAVPSSVRAAAELGHPVVIGTTGWDGELEAVRRTAEQAGIGVVHGANFSLGTHLFYRMVAHAAELVSAFERYDPLIQEAHHKGKRDRPSGTAVELGRILGERYGARHVPVASLRAGHIPGTHAVGFDSAADTITLEHRARSRQGFAEGALLAARWIAGRSGFHDFTPVLDELYPGNGA